MGCFWLWSACFLGKSIRYAGQVCFHSITFIIVMTGWVFFRNEDLHYALGVIKQMYAFNFFDGRFALNNDFLFASALALIISLFALSKTTSNPQQSCMESFSNGGRWLALVAGAVMFYMSRVYFCNLILIRLFISGFKWQQKKRTYLHTLLTLLVIMWLLLLTYIKYSKKESVEDTGVQQTWPYGT